MAVANPVPLSAFKSGGPVAVAAPKVWMLPSESGLEWNDLAHYLKHPIPYSGSLKKLLFNGIGVTDPFYKSEESLYPSRNLIINDENLRKFQEISKISGQIDDDGMPLNDEATKAFEDLMDFADEIEPMMFPENLLSFGMTPIHTGPWGGVSQKQLDRAASHAPEGWEERAEQRASEVAHKKAEKLKKDEEDKKSEAKVAIDRVYSRSRMDYAGGSEDVEGLDYTTLESMSRNKSMNIENKAKELVAQLLGENEGITVLGWSTDGGNYPNWDPDFVDIADQQGLVQQVLKGTVFSTGNYIYYPGYNGGDGNQDTGITIHSNTPLELFDDFYGNPGKYPVIAEISKALEDAGYEGLDGFGAGKLESKG